MHELSIVENIVRTTEESIRSTDPKEVKYVLLQVGNATGVIPKYLHMYWAEVCANTLLAGAELRIEEIEAEAFCKNCGEVFYPFRTRQVCPSCNMVEYELIHGEELMIKEVGFL